MILGVLGLLLFGPASSAAQSGPPAVEADVAYTGETVGVVAGGLDQDVVYLDNVDVTATLRADSSSAGRGGNGLLIVPIMSLAARLRVRVARRGGVQAAVLDGVPGDPADPGAPPRINAERPSRSSVDTLDVPPNRWEKKAAAKRAPSGWHGRSVTRTTTS